MKYVSIGAVLLSTLMVASCATTTLEQIVEDRHQQRIDASHANAPLTRGANDGLGSAIAETGGYGMTLSQTPAQKNQ